MPDIVRQTCPEKAEDSLRCLQFKLSFVMPFASSFIKRTPVLAKLLAEITLNLSKVYLCIFCPKTMIRHFCWKYLPSSGLAVMRRQHVYDVFVGLLWFERTYI